MGNVYRNKERITMPKKGPTLIWIYLHFTPMLPTVVWSMQAGFFLAKWHPPFPFPFFNNVEEGGLLSTPGWFNPLCCSSAVTREPASVRGPGQERTAACTTPSSRTPRSHPRAPRVCLVSLAAFFCDLWCSIVSPSSCHCLNRVFNTYQNKLKITQQVQQIGTHEG